MPILGGPAIGRLALGQISSDATATLTGVAGIGVARGVTPNPAALLIGAAGIGTAGTIRGTDAKTLTGAAGTGQAGVLFGSVQVTVPGTAGTGVCGLISGSLGGQLLGCVGNGVAGIITVSISGGGTSRKMGLEPVIKRPKPKPLRAEITIPLPPKAPPVMRVAVAPRKPIPVVDPSLIPSDLATMQQDALSALDAADAQDIADILALLD